MRHLITALVMGLFFIGSQAGANTFTAEGPSFEPFADYAWRGASDRMLPDGSFEDGLCYDGITWECAADNSCEWIVDLVPLGLWNYDGQHIAWLGGFCDGLATCTSSVCQEVSFGPYPCFLTWWWMAYVNVGGTTIKVTVDGETIYTTTLLPSDHLLDYQLSLADITDFADITGMLCFEYHNETGCLGNTGDSYFVDFVEFFDGITASAPASFSTVKRLY